MTQQRQRLWWYHQVVLAILVLLSPPSRLWAADPLPQTPWQTNASGTLTTNIAWNYAMGYHFTPFVNGQITQLGAYVNGTKTVKLFNKSTGALLASATVTASNTWSATPISPVNVKAGTTYTVAVYLAGSGGSYRYGLNPSLPITVGDIRVDGSTYVYTASSPTARPTNIITTTMYGQADITFVPGLPGNLPPVANAGVDQTIPGSSMVTLDARASKDPEGQPLAYQWSQTAGPAVTLANTTSATPTFTAPVSDLIQKTLTFQVIVSDGLLRAFDWVTITIAKSPTAPQTPWASNATGTLTTNVGWNYAMGYHFTPLVDGKITHLGGFFNGAKTVKLFNRATGALLASATVTSANAWAYASIAPVSVTKNTAYTIAVYLASSGGSYRSPVSPAFPRIVQDIRIDSSTYVATSTDPAARPTNSVTATMYGQVDIGFQPTPSDTTPPTPPVVTDEGLATISPSQLIASWQSSDPESGIAEYQYAIGTSAATTDVLPWTSAGTATSRTISGLTLFNGQTYFILVKAKNGAGLWSAIGASDGITVILNEDAKAYLHLYERMDAYFQGNTLRLIESYMTPYPQGQAGFAWTYDNALVISVLLARHTPEDVRRARILCETLLRNQEADGRLRDAYSAQAATAVFTTADARLGDLSWAIIAWMEYYRFSNDADSAFLTRLLDGSVKLGEFLEATMKDPIHPGYIHHIGVGYKSTEQNATLAAAFMHLYAVTQNPIWKTRAQWAKAFVTSDMWRGQRFWVGTQDNGWTINDQYSQQATDTNTIPVLAFGPKYRLAPFTVFDDFHTQADGFDGFDFNTDHDGVWFEGTGQMVTAFQVANFPAWADQFTQQLKRAQTTALNANGKGMVAASHSTVSTGFNFGYPPSLHIAATSWYLAALLHYNPVLGVSTTVPTPVLNAGYDQTVQVGDSVIFDAGNSIDPDQQLQTFTWNFGDGTTTTGSRVTHVFTSAGLITVTLTATDATGKSYEDTVAITITSPPSFPLSWSRGLGTFGSLNMGWGSAATWRNQLAVADVDQDGLPEILLGNTQGFLTSYEYANGQLRPDWRSEMLGLNVSSVAVGSLTPGAPPAILATEFNYAGFGDLFLYQGATKQLLWRKQLDKISASAIVDLTGDGQPELLFGTIAGALYVDDPRTLTQQRILTGLFAVNGLWVEDGDKDGVLEIYAATDSTLKVIDSQTKVIEWQSLWAAPSVVVADVDGDGRREIITADTYGTIWLYDPVTGKSTWNSNDLGTELRTVKVSDIEGDGTLDLVAAVDQRVIIYNGRTKAQTWQSSAFNAKVADVTVADVDGDGRPDLLVLTDIGSLSVLDGASKVTKSFTEGGVFFAVTTGDLDGDGASELVLGSQDGRCLILDGVTHHERWRLSNLGGPINAAAIAQRSDGQRWLLLGVGPQLVVINASTRLEEWRAKLDQLVTAVGAADIDADGRIDIVAATGAGATAGGIPGALYVFDSLTRVQTWRSAPLAITYGAMSIADTDGDGRQELLVGIGGYWDASTVIIVDGITKQQLWQSPVIGHGGVRGLVVADLDGDGRNEILAGSHTMPIQIFDGATKQLRGQVDHGGYLYGFTVGDVDADPNQEVIVTTGYADWVALRIFDGLSRQPEWSSEWLGEFFGYLNSLHVVDLNQDGKTEILMGGAGSVLLFGTEGAPQLDDPIPPTVKILSPTSGQSVSGTVSILIDAKDNTGTRSVEVSINERFAASLSAPPYIYDWSLATWPDQVYANTIEVRAFDLGGHMARDAITLFNDANPPTKPLLDPVVSPIPMATTTLSGRKDPETSVWVQSVERVPRDASALWSSEMLLNEGWNILFVKAKNSRGVESASALVSILVDTTPPTTPTVTDDGATTKWMTKLHVTATSSDAQTGIVEYQYAIGTTPGAIDVLAWTSNGNSGNITATNLTLTYNRAYYVAVKTKNGAGTWSSIGVSDGMTITERPPLITNIIPADRSTATQGDTITIQFQASDPDGDAVESRITVDGQVIKDWSGQHNSAWQPGTSAYGDHQVVIEARDATDGTTTKPIPMWVFVKPVGPPS